MRLKEPDTHRPFTIPLGIGGFCYHGAAKRGIVVAGDYMEKVLSDKGNDFIPSILSATAA